MSKKFVIGIDLGGTNLKIALFNLSYKIIDKQVLNTRFFTKKEELILAVLKGIEGILAKNGLSKNDLIGAGVGLPGPVDNNLGIVHFMPNIPGWKEVKLKKLLGAKLRIPVFIDNDAKLMALAEYKLGNARRFKNVLCLTLGTGVGGGIIINGSLYRGANNAAGEIGHLPLNEEGHSCNCGAKACLETYVGNNMIMHEAAKMFKRPVSLIELSAKAQKRNKYALKIWQNVGMRIGLAIAAVVTLLNLDAVIIGGGVANAGNVLFEPLKKALRNRAMPVQASHVKIFKAKLGENAGLFGAAVLVKEGAERT